MLNAVTKGFFDTNLKAFAGFGSKLEYDNSWELTATELLGGIFGSNMGMDRQNYDLPKVITKNLKDNGGMMIAQLIAIPIAFKYGRKLLGTALIRPANKLLAPAGVRI